MEETSRKSNFKNAFATAMMAGGDAISGIYGQRGNTYATYLDAQTKRQQMQADADKLRMESDPKIQAAKLASTMAMLGDSAAAERLMAFSQDKTIPYAQPSQTAQPPTIPNYIGGERPQLNSSSIRPGLVSPIQGSMGGMGFGGLGVKSVKMPGGISIGQQSQSLDPISAANLDIQKGLVSKDLQAQQDVSKGADKTVTGLDDYLKQYGRSWTEMKSKNPDIGAEGLGGKLNRLKGEFDVWSDNAPETKAMRAMAEPFAQQIATDLEGRATDQDRSIQKKNFADVLNGPTSANVRIASNSLISLQRKGGDASKVVDKLASSGVAPLMQIAEQFYKEFPSSKQSISLDKNLMSEIDKELARRNSK